MAVVVVCTILVALAGRVFPDIAEANLVMAYLLGVVFVATRYGRGPSILASILSVAAFDFFFVQPQLTFVVSNTQYLVTFAVMLLVALVISTLTVRMQQQAQAARERERRTAALYAMSRDFAGTRGLPRLLAAAVQHIGETFDAQVAVLLPDERNQRIVQPVGRANFVQEANERGVAQWVYDHREAAGRGTNTLAGSEALYLPLVASQAALGVIGICPQQARRLLDPEQFHLLETFANQTALAIERARLADEAERAKVQIETERLRNSLLSSVSHDLRTPPATITGATTTLLDNETALDPATRRDLTQAIAEEAERLNRLVRNLLDMTRLESGAVEVRKEWQPLEEVVGAALGRLDQQLRDRPIDIDLPADLPLVPIDAVLIEQVLVNLLENALKYTPPASPLTITARKIDGAIAVEVADRGPGLPPGTEQRVFDKFFRATPQGGQGVGLGLAIAVAIVRAHGGVMNAENRADGGALFRFTLPLDGTPPPIETEATAATHPGTRHD